MDDAYIFKYIPKQDASFLDYLNIFKQRFEISDYRPIAYFTYGMEQYFLGDIFPKISHGINLILFIVICYVGYRAVLLMPNKDKSSNNFYLAAFVGFIFLIHPIHTSVVVNLKSRDGLFSMLFFLLAILQMLQYFKTDRKIYLLGVLLFNILSMMSKLDGVMFFMVYWVFVLAYKRISPLAIIFGLLLFFIDLNWLAFVDAYIPEPEGIKNLPVLFNENPILQGNTFSQKVSQSLQTYYWYLKFMVKPEYYFYYGYNTIPTYSIFDAHTIFYGISHIVLLFSVIFAWIRKEYVYCFGIGFFYLTLSGFSNLLQPVPGIIADRYAFIASFGFILAFSYLFFRIINRIITKEETRRYLYYGMAVLIFIFFFPSIREQRDKWKDFPTLMEHDMPHLTQSFDANRIAAVNYYKQAMQNSDRGIRGEYLVQSMKYAEQAIQVYNDNILVKEFLGMAYKDYGDKFSAKKQFVANLEQCDTSYVSMEGLGDIYFMERDYKNAARMYLKLIAGMPNYETPYYKLSNTFSVSGNFDKTLAFNDSLIAHHKMGYIPFECKGYGYFTIKDSIAAAHSFLDAFDKGLENSELARTVEQIFLQSGDNENAKKARVYGL